MNDESIERKEKKYGKSDFEKSLNLTDLGLYLSWAATEKLQKLQKILKTRRLSSTSWKKRQIRVKVLKQLFGHSLIEWPSAGEDQLQFESLDCLDVFLQQLRIIVQFHTNYWS